MTTKRIRAFVLAAAVTALMGSGAFAQADTPPAAEPGGSMMTPAEMSPAETPAPTLAQTPSSTLNQSTSPNATTTAPRNDGFGWGWIGLLGLIGLTGLSRRDAKHVERDATTYPAKRTDATAQGGLR